MRYCEGMPELTAQHLLDAEQQGEDARVDEALRLWRRASRDETLIAAELAAGPDVGREFQLLRRRRRLDERERREGLRPERRGGSCS